MPGSEMHTNVRNNRQLNIQSPSTEIQERRKVSLVERFNPDQPSLSMQAYQGSMAAAPGVRPERMWSEGELRA
jgi:hypothetical protein